VLVHASGVAGARTGRIGVVVTPDGERSFVTDRGAADLLRPADLKASWFASAQGVHMPVYSLLGSPPATRVGAPSSWHEAGRSSASIWPRSDP
jgi:sugar/nucleoside kinase (ribokinase family)